MLLTLISIIPKISIIFVLVGTYILNFLLPNNKKYFFPMAVIYLVYNCMNLIYFSLLIIVSEDLVLISSYKWEFMINIVFTLFTMYGIYNNHKNTRYIT